MAITYAISGGADAAKFNINATSGVLTFKAAPDFESPGDANKDNIYEVQVKATDAGGASSTKDMQVTVKDISDNLPPQITSAGAVAVNENQTAVTTVTATDPDDGGVTPPPSGGKVPLTWDDPMFANCVASQGVGVPNNGTVSNKSITSLYNNTAGVVGLGGNYTMDTVRMNVPEGVRLTQNGTVVLKNSYIETHGAAGDHADGIQCYGPSSVTCTMTNCTVKSESSNATAGFFTADGCAGNYNFNNVVFIGGPYGLRINADRGSGSVYNVALKDVFFVQPFGYAPLLIYIPSGYGGAQLNFTQWENVCNATIQNGQLVPGAAIPKPTGSMKEPANEPKRPPPRRG